MVVGLIALVTVRSTPLPVHERIDTAEAVAMAAALASDGDTVLMAPAAASMDQFTSYAHRGDAFIDAVRALLESRASAAGES